MIPYEDSNYLRDVMIPKLISITKWLTLILIVLTVITLSLVMMLIFKPSVVVGIDSSGHEQPLSARNVQNFNINEALNRTKAAGGRLWSQETAELPAFSASEAIAATLQARSQIQEPMANTASATPAQAAQPHASWPTGLVAPIPAPSTSVAPQGDNQQGAAYQQQPVLQQNPAATHNNGVEAAPVPAPMPTPQPQRQ